MLKECPLPFHDFLGDVLDRALPLVKAFDQELPGLDLLADVFAGFSCGFRIAEEVLVEIADPQVGHVIVIGIDDEFVPRLLHKNLRDDILVVLREKFPAGMRFQMTDALGSLLNCRSIGAKSLGNFGKAPPAQRFQVILYNRIFQRVLLSDPLQLKHQAFPKCCW